MIRVLTALFLLVHGSIHVGYICSRSWPFEATDPWLVTRLAASSDLVQIVGAALALLTFLVFLLAAAATIAPFPRWAWRGLVAVGSVASATMLVGFMTSWTLPGLVIDAALLWTTLGRGRTTAGPRVGAGQPVA
ncbi:MAG TPA: hypothetical protein VF763_00235 [Candidatus Limnocylindrales bacterium]